MEVSECFKKNKKKKNQKSNFQELELDRLSVLTDSQLDPPA